MIAFSLTLNGVATRGWIPAQMTLLEWLRGPMALTGTKSGCDRGECGACMVWLDGQPVLSCITLAAEAQGGRVRTIEDLAPPGGLHPLQVAFAEAGAAQCGFCTPGILMAAAALLEGPPPHDLPALRDALSGNLCRCTGYQSILKACLQAAQTMAQGRDEVDSGGYMASQEDHESDPGGYMASQEDHESDPGGPMASQEDHESDPGGREAVQGQNAIDPGGDDGR